MQFITRHLDYVNIISSYKSGVAISDLAERHSVGIHIIYKVLENCCERPQVDDLSAVSVPQDRPIRKGKWNRTS
jgi:hypothetical protein